MHRTKSKADIGLAKVIANLMEKGYVLNSPNCPKVIRFDKSANSQQNIKWANDYLDIKRESSETIRHTPETAKT